jgi:hypothetical protein
VINATITPEVAQTQTLASLFPLPAGTYLVWAEVDANWEYAETPGTTHRLGCIFNSSGTPGGLTPSGRNGGGGTYFFLDPGTTANPGSTTTATQASETTIGASGLGQINLMCGTYGAAGGDTAYGTITAEKVNPAN